MDQNVTSIERAFQLAKSGACVSITDLKKLLKSEGYSADQIEGRVISKQLTTLIRNARVDSPVATVSQSD